MITKVKLDQDDQAKAKEPSQGEDGEEITPPRNTEEGDPDPATTATRKAFGIDQEFAVKEAEKCLKYFKTKYRQNYPLPSLDPSRARGPFFQSINEEKLHAAILNDQRLPVKLTEKVAKYFDVIAHENSPFRTCMPVGRPFRFEMELQKHNDALNELRQKRAPDAEIRKMAGKVKEYRKPC